MSSKKSNSKSYLPKISASSFNSNVDTQISNPFYMPEDYEIFKVKEENQKIKREKQRELMNQKIWDKGAKNSYMSGKLKSLWQDLEPRQQEQDKQLNIIDAANNAIKNKVNIKEPIQKFVQQKRDMFLFQMLIDQKRDQIMQFQENIRTQELGLQKSEQNLEEDLETFNEFLEKNKIESRDMIKKAEDKTKEKQQKISEIKQLNEQKSELIAKNAMRLENLIDLWKYKSFLDKTTVKNDNRVVKKNKTVKKNRINLEIYQMKLDEDLVEMIQDSDEEFEMFYKDPQQLEKLFEEMEGQNLNFIMVTKALEAKQEEARKTFIKEKEQLDIHKNELLKQQQKIKKQIEAINNESKQVKTVNSDNEIEELLGQLEEQIRECYYKYHKGTTVGHHPNDKNKGLIQIKEMENILEGQIKFLINIKAKNPKALQEEEKACKESRRNQVKNDLKQQQEELLKQKQDELKKKPPQTRRMGRPIMYRSLMHKDEIKEEVVEQIDEEKMDILKYFT